MRAKTHSTWKTVSLGLLLSGCTVSFPQVDSVVDLVQAELNAIKEGEPAQDTRWSASYNGTGRLMTPYLEGGLTIFVSEQGDAVAFDGWLIRSLGGFDQGEIIRVNDDENQRIYNKGSSRTIGECGSWVNSGTSDGSVTWTQLCENPDAKNTIRLNDSGLIVQIDQVIDGSGGRITLNKL